MIEFENKLNIEPYKTFYNLYKKAHNLNQTYIEACSVSSFNVSKKEVSSRYVNVKYFLGEELIFFSNYSSSKAIDFTEHQQVSIIFFWDKINVQIRMKAHIKKMPTSFNSKYFRNRNIKKNALAISSRQSAKVSSYKEVQERYNTVFHQETVDLSICPEYWGGYAMKPYYIEFWEGHESRINKREVFNKIDGLWKHSYLQP